MNTNFCLFKEGRVAIPQGYVDRTLNILADGQSQLPAVNISRDSLPAGMALGDYINSQLGELQRNVQGWEEQERTEMALGDNVFNGFGLSYNFLRPDNVRLWQKQAVFDLGNGAILIFSSSKASGFNEQDEARFLQVLASFTPHSA